MLQAQPYALVQALAALASALAVRVMWRRRRQTPAAGALAVVLAGAAEWSAVLAVGGTLESRSAQTVLACSIFPGVGAIVVGFVCLARGMTDRSWVPAWRREGLLLVEPAAVLVAVASNPWHHAFFRSYAVITDPLLVDPVPGPLFWLHTAYSYVLLAGATALLVRAARRASAAHRRRFLWPVAGAGFPIVGNAIGLFVTHRTGMADLTSVGFVLTALLCGWALRAEALPDVLPVAHRQVLETISDGVLVVDAQRRIVDANPAAEALARRISPGIALPLVGSPLAALAPTLELDPDAASQQLLRVAAAELDLDLRTSPLADDAGRPMGWVLVGRDVTAHLEQQRELERQRHEAVRASAALREHLDLVERLQAELAEQAEHDPLTGLYNRRRLVTALERDVPETLASGRPVSLVMVDADHFKRINDVHGHVVGDAVLQGIADALADAVRSPDLVARFGGEEFVVVLHGCPERTAQRRAEELRERCARVVVTSRSGERVATTVSIGVAALERECATDAGEALLRSADAALYAAKDQGRDRVVVGVRA
ncbi:diguanylate cyclase (GGDEF)-like protein [Motilibacter rhizosphaerae]|uniref:Diguanylate cyclase (GGDEF)-like protein n=1 Tax=Motilibacter rhizosphaerae TaxID=598652 RepID=A0A4Q7NT97_9ACTN|nr:diguanylate cyclase [Motilibacter rhizosphaerae]RZS89612.1 diguanylate cyclase (GGDEF)-like protein [Motilibacter rhizosphaerae]